MFRLMQAAALAAGLLLANAAASTADDAGDVRDTIAAQLRAFKAGDGDTAYSYAAPNIRAMFPTSSGFMAMVRGGYAVVADSNNVTFGPLTPIGSEGFRQDVNMTDGKGQSYIASYTLMRQADGSMKITGCSIRKGDDVSA
ncbi:DUF4864 domain-containing protein [Aureimonas leprariae]|uniref:DUF4864 domain-containing protein n=1 Tax=Plantimonas leprariae TaxID=2615207 RepID=A0A7V7PL54_9HYPH|nr:DUF4864 domain-containing protein [Aureimonas leprariae]KAB0676699.1 DUF4864 domain-containing protein [Aureimonas leprariae]